MMIRYLLFIAGFLTSSLVVGQGLKRPVMHLGDTMYFSRDLLPHRIDLEDAGQDIYWDMTRLLAPFVHQSLVRPDGNGGMVITGPDDVDRYFTEREDGLYLSRLGLPDPATGNRTMVYLDPPMPYVKNVKMDDAWVYQGTLSMFSTLSPREVKLSIIVYAQVDAAGELLSPTLRYDVLRERRDVEISLAPGGAAVNPSDLRLPPCLTEGITYAFIGSASPMPLALVQVDAMNQAKQVEYISHPWAGTVIQQMPRRPDVFVYPNPSFGNVRFDFLNLPTGYYDLEIYNILGSKIRTERIYINGVKTLPLDLSRFKKGTYIYRLVDDQKNTIRSKRLVIITA